MTLIISICASLSFLMACVLSKQLIKIARMKGLFDETVELRKIHLHKTPNLGGVAIFISSIFSITLLYKFIQPIQDLHLIFAGTSIVFVTGLIDDLIGIAPYKKLGIQIFAAFVVTSSPSLRLSHLPGLVVPEQLSVPISTLISVFLLVLLMNAYNLIDGIDWLAGTFVLTTISLFAILFYSSGDFGLSTICIVISASLIGFLIYNKTPASLFMGDSGSLSLGMIIGILSILLSNKSPFNSGLDNLAIITTMLTLPVFDTARVFFVRIYQKKSPFAADKNHLHHLLLSLGLGHIPSTFILLLSNIPSFLIIFNWEASIHIKAPVLVLVSLLTFYSLFYITRIIIDSSKKYANRNSSHKRPAELFPMPNHDRTKKVMMEETPFLNRKINSQIEV